MCYKESRASNYIVCHWSCTGIQEVDTEYGKKQAKKGCYVVFDFKDISDTVDLALPLEGVCESDWKIKPLMTQKVRKEYIIVTHASVLFVGWVGNLLLYISLIIIQCVVGSVICNIKCVCSW